MSGELVPMPDDQLTLLAEIYGENTAFVSAKDIDELRNELSGEEFEQLSSMLGWQEGDEGVDT